MPSKHPISKVARPSKHRYFTDLARLVATRSTCDRAHVGCVLVRDDHIIATGYNGSPAGLPHCDDVGHLMEGGHCIRVIHAEENALLQCAQQGIRSRDAVCYCSFIPCLRCAQRLLTAGISRVYYADEYGTHSVKYWNRLATIADAMPFYRYVDSNCILVRVDQRIRELKGAK